MTDGTPETIVTFSSGSAAAVLVGALSAGVFAFFWWLLPTTMSGET
jgi:hypothetical protein